MSLEQALADNTAAINKLIATWSQLTSQANNITAGGTPLKEVAKQQEKAAPKPETAAAPTTQAAAAAQTASSTEASASPAVSFDQLKKAFLSLSTKEGGRAKCEGVLKPHGLGKLSEAKEEQYGALLAAIEKASA